MSNCTDSPIISSMSIQCVLFLRVDKGGCSMRQAKGLYFWLVESGIWIITSDIGRERVLRKCVLDEECWISPVSSVFASELDYILRTNFANKTKTKCFIY